ncbi:uncharacterized protein LOC126187836 [Schistocerca cancellata]|uniref:uncharacterized protein LOC126187836 n=1 Tax=Schistocerca cancellata TaxID=274614 RepID=UPI002117B8C1|nr:uncharacterized protein LOC126187836 [Schistocerca cancellata]
MLHWKAGRSGHANLDSILLPTEFKEALSVVYQCCEKLREPVPQRTEAAMGRSMLGAAVHATWAMVAEAVAQEAERLRATWGLPLKPPGYFWQPPVILPISSRPSTKATDKASSASRQKRSGKQASPSSSVQPSASQESGLKAEVDPATEHTYLAALYVCTYHHVATAVDWTTAAIESHTVLTP